jgi:uncharacterized repeat protein (TIGR01451 family)
MLTWLGLVLSVLILTMVTLTFVQAQGSAASITILKEADQMVVRGSSASFSIDVRNSGDVTLTNVTVSDTLAPSCNRVFAELLSGEHRSYTCAVTGVTEDFVNTATVTGTTPEGGEVTHSDTASVDVIDPDIQIAKTPDQQMVVRGSSASFNIDVSNTGDVALTNVTVSDAEAPNCNRTFAELLSGAHQSYSCAVAGVTEDFVNTATVTGTAPVGGEVTHSDTASVDVVDLGIQIAKTPDQQVVVRGSSASFNIDVRNSGDVTLTNVTVSDVQAPNCNRAFAQLLSGAHRSYACAVANVTDGFINSATVTGTAQHTGQNVTDADAAKVRLDDTGTCPASMIAYWKLDEPNGVTTYDDFYYGHDGECADDCPTLATGQVNGGQAFDGYNDGIDVPLVPGDDSFDWGAQDSFSIEYWLQPDSDGCSGNQVVVGRDDSSTNLHWWTGCWTGGQAAFVLGDTDGGGDIQILVGDTKLNDGFWHHVVAVRDASAGENRLYVDGTVEAATPATYTAGFGSPTVGLNIGWLDLLGGFHFDGILDEVAVYDRALSTDEIEQHYDNGDAGPGYCISPDIGVKKAVDAMVVYPGSLATYIYTVTNPGDVPLSAIRWHDDKCSPVTFVGGDGDGDNLLDPIETWVYTCSMTLNTDITNTVIVTGSPSLGDKITSVDVVFVDVISPAIGIDKVADPALVYAGDTVVYTYTVTNPGDDPLSYVHVSDDQCSPVTEAGGDDNGNYALDPDETWTYACSTVPDAATTNTATATGTDSAGGPVSAMDVDPTLTVFKRADDDIVFEFTITSANTDKALYLRNGGWAQLADLAPDSYTITETVVSQWKLVSITCTNGISLDAPDTPAVTVGLQSAQDVSCTFTNRKANRIFLPTVLRD